MTIRDLSLIIILAPLLGSVIAGLAGKTIGKRATHCVTIFLMIVAFIASIMVLQKVVIEGNRFYGDLYTWGTSGNFRFNIGLMIDQLTSIMMLVVTFISLVVNIYSIGYMRDDPGYQRFFSYVSLFTFSMILLVTANNFLQLFFGWEGVGLVSYLLIGFWFEKESAAIGGLKAFIVNRMGDFGFILGIAAILDYFDSLDYQTVFAHAQNLTQTTVSLFPNTHWSVITVACVLLFIGAMGKSAQMPLHVWLPESMEGPTPISALIHAATMVTAGVFMVARLSPLYELSTTALSLVLIIGATGGLFLGLLAFVENDIKRVIAFSTMSQLGYMMAANGVSAYSAGIFHLLNHANFKALLFLAAGSVIIAMHHEQDLRKMGNLKKYLPVTYVCFLIGALTLASIPPFSGFYSKDIIIETVQRSTLFGAKYSYVCLLLGSFVTAYYIFRAFFLAFHTQERMDEKTRSHLKEHWVMLVPLILLAIPSVLAGAILVRPFISQPGILRNSVEVLAAHNVLGQMAQEFHGAFFMMVDAIRHWGFWFAVAGISVAWFATIGAPVFREKLMQRFKILYRILVAKYGFDQFNNLVFVQGGKKLADFFYKVGDLKMLDQFVVDGSGRRVTKISEWMKRFQSGYLYHYVLVMIIGLVVFLGWMLFR